NRSMNATRMAMTMIAPTIARKTITAASFTHEKSPQAGPLQGRSERVATIVISKYFPSQGKCFPRKGKRNARQRTIGAACKVFVTVLTASALDMSAILEGLQPSSLALEDLARRWVQLVKDPVLRNLPYRIELS